MHPRERRGDRRRLAVPVESATTEHKERVPDGTRSLCLPDRSDHALLQGPLDLAEVGVIRKRHRVELTLDRGELGR